MSKDEREFLDALRARSIEAAAEILEGVQRLKSLYEEVTNDGSGVAMPRPRLGDHLYQVAKLELEHASALIKLGNSHADVIFEHLRALARRTQKQSAAVLVLEPPSRDDTTCVGQLEVRNPLDSAADVRFELTPLKTATGEPVEGAVVRARGRHGAHTVRAYDSLVVELVAHRPAETRFGAVKVFLSAAVEKQVAHRIVKVRAAKAEP